MDLILIQTTFCSVIGNNAQRNSYVGDHVKGVIILNHVKRYFIHRQFNDCLEFHMLDGDTIMVADSLDSFNAKVVEAYTERTVTEIS